MPKSTVRDAPEPVTLNDFPSLWTTLILTAAAGGMGWGIRGQYGHETGAMMAGLLVALVIGLLFCQRQSSLFAARLAALTAIGIGFGGSMTYGQTVGLTHDAELVGNWAALRWGLLGLAIKGGIWIGFAGVLMGMALGGKRYRALEILLLFIVLFGLCFVGLYALNEPFDPANRQLPKIYFSDDWYWEPNKADLEPRRERWGGLLFALAGLWFYVAAIKRDAIARNLGLFGIVFGALGFAGGQCVQAYHSWNLANFQQGWLGRIEPYMNWWNTMETIFGMVLGLGLGLGVWLHRRQLPQAVEDEVELSPCGGIGLPRRACCFDRGLEFHVVRHLRPGRRPCPHDGHFAARAGGRRPIFAVPHVAAHRRLSHRRQDAPRDVVLQPGNSAGVRMVAAIRAAHRDFDVGGGVPCTSRSARRQRAVVLAVEPAPDKLDVFCPQLRLLPLSLAVGAADIPHAECNRVCRVLAVLDLSVPVLPFAIQPPERRRNLVMSANVTEWLTQRRRDRRGEPKGTLIGTDPR